MTEPRHRALPPGRWSRFWAAFRSLLPGRAVPRRVRPAPAGSRPPPRLGMESLEQRTALSDTLLGALPMGFMAPPLWGGWPTSSLALPRLEDATPERGESQALPHASNPNAGGGASYPGAGH